MVRKDRVRKLMQLHGINVNGQRKFLVITDSNHRFEESENLVGRDFHSKGPNKVWGFLAVLVDLFNQEIVSWNMEYKMDNDLAVDAL